MNGRWLSFAARGCGLEVVGQEPEPLVGGEGVHCAEVAAVEGEHRGGPLLGRQGNVDHVGQVQVQVETCVLMLDHACRIEDLKASLWDVEA
jgi:hypothetical protein